MSARWLGGTILLVALLIAVYVALRSEQASRAFRDTDLRVAEPDRSNGAPDAAQVDRQREESSTPQTETGAEASQTAAPMPPEIEYLRVRYPFFAGMIETAERDLGGQGKDPLWSGAMEARIVGEISQKALGLEITDLQVDCRTSLCRVQMTFPLQLLERKFDDVPPDAAWNGQQPVSFFLKALDLPLREGVAAGLNEYGTPVVVAYVDRPRQPPVQ
jgi:hypothetical protein